MAVYFMGNFDLLAPIAGPLGTLLYFIYDKLVFQNYGLALIIFTLLVRLALLPLTIKQYQSSAKMQDLQPQIQEVQKRYKNDKEKLNQELMKVYSENKVNPAGGCLPLLIQMPILFALWRVISQPLQYMLGFSWTRIEKMWETLSKIKELKPVLLNGYKDLDVANYFTTLDAGKTFSEAGKHLLNMDFLGLNLGLVPTYDFSKMSTHTALIPILILPILAVATTFISAKFSMPKQKSDQPGANVANTMIYIAPLMTLMFAFQMPAGMSLYWTVGNFVAIGQQWYIKNHIIKPKEVTTK